MPTDFIDEEIGSAVVKKSFQTRVNPNRAKEGAIGGCVIQNGIIKKDHYFRIYRKHECIYEGIFTPQIHRLSNGLREVGKGSWKDREVGKNFSKHDFPTTGEVASKLAIILSIFRPFWLVYVGLDTIYGT